jgi:UDP-N-acetylmuramyl pentapeptide phosphotransferase/UDP-N-acetylglucosamine-1-phosphate transferase
VAEAPALFAAAALALVIAAAVAGLAAWAGPVDAPRSRGSHARPTPTSGGISIIAGTSLGLLWFVHAGGAGSGQAAGVAQVLLFAGATGLIGALDDLHDLGAKAKLPLQGALALVFAIAVARIEALPLGPHAAIPLGPVVGALGTALWIVVTTNAVNFMDGSNGLAAGAAAIALAAFGVAASSSGLELIGAAALSATAAAVGFLPWNLRARLFQGDAGALFSGALLAGLAVLAAGRGGRGPVGLYLAPLALLPLLTDVLLTLLWRARRGRSLLQAHRDHLYQLWLQRTGGSHLALAWRAWLATALCAAVALAVQARAPAMMPAAFAISVGVLALAWYAARRSITGRP